MDFAVPLDLRSIFFVSGVSSLLGAAFLFGMRPRDGALRGACGLFALAVSMMAAGFVGLGTAGMPDTIAWRVLSNVLVSGATVVIWGACSRLAERPARPLMMLVALGTLAAALVPLSTQAGMQPLRHLLGSVWALGFLGLALRELLAAPNRGDGAWQPARWPCSACCWSSGS
jgi:hypothetical protein